MEEFGGGGALRGGSDGEVWVGNGRQGVGAAWGVCKGSFVAIVSVNVEAAELHGKQTVY